MGQNTTPRIIDNHIANDRNRIRAQTQQINNTIINNLDRILAGLIDLATGDYYEAVDDNGKTIIVYTKKPDFAAGSYLLNRVDGKPTERHEIGEAGAFDYDTFIQGRLARVVVPALPAPEPDVIDVSFVAADDGTIRVTDD